MSLSPFIQAGNENFYANLFSNLAVKFKKLNSCYGTCKPSPARLPHQ